MHGDVQPGMSHCLAGRGKSAGVTQLCPDRHGDNGSHSIAGLQRPAARLAAGKRSDLATQPNQLGVQPIEYPQCRQHRLVASRRQPDTLFQTLPTAGGEQVTLRDRHPLVVMPLAEIPQSC
jgi:hypothetical protein